MLIRRLSARLTIGEILFKKDLDTLRIVTFCEINEFNETDGGLPRVSKVFLAIKGSDPDCEKMVYNIRSFSQIQQEKVLTFQLTRGSQPTKESINFLRSCGDSAEPILTLLCPNGTLYNQQYFVCDWWFNVDCSVVRKQLSIAITHLKL